MASAGQDRRACQGRTRRNQTEPSTTTRTNHTKDDEAYRLKSRRRRRRAEVLIALLLSVDHRLVGGFGMTERRVGREREFLLVVLGAPKFV